jgi:8-oxo-dGTP pyrophosphatase MutT (NUDIX family)
VSVEAGLQSIDEITRPQRVVRAAGGLVLRGDRNGGVEVVVVHRRTYDDWEFPKGKLDPGEADADAALREVEEETGLRCRLGREIGSLSYVDVRGRPKSVRYWEMHPVAGVLGPANEVDAVRWVPLAELPEALSHDRDRDILDRFERLL